MGGRGAPGYNFGMLQGSDEWIELRQLTEFGEQLLTLRQQPKGIGET
jgi:hypothetical protein